jgi:hypothetical protein
MSYIINKLIDQSNLTSLAATLVINSPVDPVEIWSNTDVINPSNVPDMVDVLWQHTIREEVTLNQFLNKTLGSVVIHGQQSQK